jgi:hypothetical protein
MPESWAELGVPLRGLNEDTSPSQLERDEAPELYNVLLHEAGQMRPRRGWRRKVNWRTRMTSPSSDRPFGVFQWRNRMLVGFNAAFGSWEPYYFGDGYAIQAAPPPPSGGSPIGTPYGVVVNADNDSAIVTATMPNPGPFGAYLPVAPSVQYGNAAYAASGQGFSSYKTNQATGLQVGAFGYPRIVKWAGAYNSVGHGVTASATVGSTAVTLSASPGVDVTNYFLRFNSETDLHEYSYQVKTHSGTDIVLYEPYGLGEAVGNKASVGATLMPMEYIYEGPLAPACVAVHQERLWAGRCVTIDAIGDIVKGEYRTAVTWSKPGQPEKWPDQNIIILDDSPIDKVMGFAKVGRNFAVFLTGKIFEITGYSEDTYAANLITDELGCIDARSIVQYREGVIFMSSKGVFYYDGAQLTDMTHPTPGHGVRKTFNAQTAVLTEARRASCAALVEDYLVTTQQDPGTYARQDGLYTYLASGAWCKWGNAVLDEDQRPWLLTLSGQKINGKTWAICKQYAVELDTMFGPEDDDTADADRYDQVYNTTTAAAETAYVPTTIRWKDFRLMAGDTTRALQLFIDHNVHYTGSADATQQGWNVTFNTDPHPSDGSGSAMVGEIQPRRITVAQPEWDAYYTEQFPLGGSGGASREGAILRLRLSNYFTSEVAGRPQSMKLFGARLLLEGTRPARVDNAVIT